jgi:hypothetical protein
MRSNLHVDRGGLDSDLFTTSLHLGDHVLLILVDPGRNEIVDVEILQGLVHPLGIELTVAHHRLDCTVCFRLLDQ